MDDFVSSILRKKDKTNFLIIKECSFCPRLTEI